MKYSYKRLNLESQDDAMPKSSKSVVHIGRELYTHHTTVPSDDPYATQAPPAQPSAHMDMYKQGLRDHTPYPQHQGRTITGGTQQPPSTQQTMLYGTYTQPQYTPSSQIPPQYQQPQQPPQYQQPQQPQIPPQYQQPPPPVHDVYRPYMSESENTTTLLTQYLKESMDAIQILSKNIADIQSRHNAYIGYRATLDIIGMSIFLLIAFVALIMYMIKPSHPRL